MRILLVSPWEERVPPRKYGGTELVVYNLCEGLVERGHEVYLVASGNSKTSAHLLPVIKKSIREMFKKDLNMWRDYYKYSGIARVLETINKLKPDIVHNHYNWRLLLFSNLIPCPVLTTVHGPLTSIQERETYKAFKSANFISISNNQRRAMPSLNWIKTIYNGIDISKYTFNSTPRDYFVFLGRTSPEKGLAEVIRAIKKTKHKLKIAAKVDPTDLEYFDKKVKPHIDGKQIEFLGEVDHKGKNELLKGARALLLWLNWEEPFGLVVPEAMACGTPVIVNPRGSMRELVVNGKTGFLVNSLGAMRQKFDIIEQIDRSFCRKHVEENFSKEKMVREYLGVITRLVQQQLRYFPKDKQRLKDRFHRGQGL